MNNLNIDLSIAETYLRVSEEKFTYYKVLVDKNKVISFIFGNNDCETDPIKQSVLLDLVERWNTKSYLIKCDDFDGVHLYQDLQDLLSCEHGPSIIQFLDYECFVYFLTKFYDAEIPNLLEICSRYSARIFELKELSNLIGE